MSVEPFTYKHFNSSDASDALNSLGYIGVVKGLHPVTSPAALIGKAVPVLIAPRREGYPSLRDGILGASLSADKDSILFIVSERKEYAAFGGFLSFIAKSCGIKGVVVCGKVRDIAEIELNSIPVFAEDITPLVPAEGQSVISVGDPVKIEGLIVSKNDLIVADRNGVTIVPSKRVSDVAKIISLIQKREADARLAVAEEIRKHRTF